MQSVKQAQLQLVRSPAAPLIGAPLAPVSVYLDSLNRPASRVSMRGCLDRAARLMGAASADEITWGALRAPHVKVLKARMQRAGYRPPTVNATLSALRGVAREAWLLGDQGMSVDDYQRIAAVRSVRSKRDRRGRALSVEELGLLAHACERDRTAAGARDACLLALMARGGLRREEVVTLSLSDFRRRDHALRVKGKGDRDRTLYFRRGGARRALLAWLRARGPSEGALVCPVDKAGRVEVRSLSTQAVYKALLKRAGQAGLKRRVTPHDLRRTFATELLERGKDIFVVQELMGHASGETTKLYDRRAERAKQAALDSLPLDYRRPRPRRRRRGRR